MVKTREEAIEQIVKTSFSLDEKQAIHVAGIIWGISVINSMDSDKEKEKK